MDVGRMVRILVVIAVVFAACEKARTAMRDLRAPAIGAHLAVAALAVLFVGAALELFTRIRARRRV